MKDLIAFLVFTCLVITTIYLVVTKQVDWKVASTFFAFSIIALVTISNYDLVKRFKWWGVEIETAKREIVETKESALKEISSEVKNQKESIELLISDVNNTRDEIERQKEALNELIRTATDLQHKIEEQKKKIIGLNKSAENTKKDIERLNIAASQTALVVIKTNYLTLMTKHEFGTKRAQKAIQEVLDELNRILPIVIPDEKERSEWIKKLKDTLPPRK